MMSVFVSVVFLIFEAISPPPLGPLLLRNLFGTQSGTQTLMPPGNKVILKTGTQNPLIYESAVAGGDMVILIIQATVIHAWNVEK